MTLDEAREQAKPCPHCGGTEIRFDLHRGAGRGRFEDVVTVCCYSCGATFPGTYNVEMLLNKWNRRV